MDRWEKVIGVAGVILAAALLTFGNLIVEVIFKAIGL